MADDRTDTWSGSPPAPPDHGDCYDLLGLLSMERRLLVTVGVDADAHGPPPADITAGSPLTTSTGVESTERVRVVLTR